MNVYTYGSGCSPGYADGSDPGYPQAGVTVWPEGTFHAAYAMRQIWQAAHWEKYMTEITSRGFLECRLTLVAFPGHAGQECLRLV